MLLASKNALVFAATGAIGSEIARTFAQEGAHVYVSGRNAEALESLADHIRADGGQATAHIVDATDPGAVDTYVRQVAEAVGHIDVVFNAIGLPPAELGYPAPSDSQDFALFMKPIEVILGSTFLTTRSAAAQMARQGGGAVVTLSATLSVMTAPNMAGITAACGGIEALTRSLAGEFGRAGVRVNCVRANAMPGTRTMLDTFEGLTRLYGRMPEPVPPPLGRPITVTETAMMAAFLASDKASGITGQVVTVSAGAFV